LKEILMPSRYNEPPRKINYNKVKLLVEELLEALGETPKERALLRHQEE
jgi:hypothetical protein